MKNLRLLAMSLAASASILIGQTFTASISGTVTDPANAVVPHARIVVTDPQRNAAYTAESDGTGHYVITNLQPGSYTLHVEASGFKKYSRTAFDLQVAQQALINP